MILSKEQVSVLRKATEALFVGQRKVPGLITVEDLCVSHEALRRQAELARDACMTLTEVASTFVKERDDARRMVCENEASVSEMEFRSCWGEDEPIEKVLADHPGAVRPTTPRQVAERRWPTEAARLFPEKEAP